MNWIIREQQRQESDYNAGSKARADVDAILISDGFKPLLANLELDTSQNAFRKITLQFSRYFEWTRCIKTVSPGDSVVIQYPVRNHTVFFARFLFKLRKRRVKTIGIIHDLESLRQAIDQNIPRVSKVRFSLEEVSALKYFDIIIVHNEHMKRSIHSLFGVSMDKMIDLGIFDYLYDPQSEHISAVEKGPVIIAGSLDRNKAGYVYNLPADVRFDLYGANLDESFKFNSNVVYKGKVKPDILPSVLKGSFGLVWDGPSTNCCEGVFGEYLKVNNPHKTSLYLAAGLPVIVWKESALADFVQENVCGIVINSVANLSENIRRVTASEYETIVQNVKSVGEKIRNGEYLKNAVRVAIR